jgi:Arc/MetJ family transcription regulator
MRTTITIDDQLLADAQELTGIHERNALIRLALKRLVEGEAASQLAAMGGSDPDAWIPERRRYPTE